MKFFLLIIQKRTTFYYWHKLQTSTVHFFETSEAKIPKLGMYYKLTLDKSISKPGTLPDIRLVSPSYAGTTPKLVKAAKFSLPSYKSSSLLWQLCVEQWWVEFDDELSLLFTKRFKVCYLICRK